MTDSSEIKRCVKDAVVAAIKARNLQLDKFQDPKLKEPTIDNIRYLHGSWKSGWEVLEEKTDWKLDLRDIEFRFAVSAALV